MTTTEKAISYMEGIARDDSHGYSQSSRWPWQGSDFDCSSLVIYSWRQAGVPLTCTYTGNMLSDMTAKGFRYVTDQVNLRTGAGMKRGDVLWRDGHTAMYCGNGLEVEAASSETGGIFGEPGDQTGYEILIQEYVPNWSVVLRYEADEEDDKVFMFECEEIREGCTGKDVKLMQAALKGRGYKDNAKHVLKIDGIWGEKTTESLLKFQNAVATKDKDFPVDGICGKKTWTKLLYR